jgi:hypothetical protein
MGAVPSLFNFTYFAIKLLGDVLDFFVGVGIAYSSMRVGLVASKLFQ